MFHEVTFIVFVHGFAGFHSLEPLATAGLETVLRRFGTLDESAMTERHDVRLVGDQILNSDLASGCLDGRQARHPVLVLDGEKLFLDDGQHPNLAGDDVHEVPDVGQNAIILILDLALLQRCELVQAKFQNLVRLNVCEDVSVADNGRLPANQNSECHDRVDRERVGLQFVEGFFTIRGVTDHLDEVIQIVDRQEEGFQFLRRGLGLAEKKARPAQHHLTAMLDVARIRVFEVQQPGAALIDRQHVRRERGLEGGVLEDVVEHHLRTGLAFEVDDDPGVLIRFITDGADFRKHLLVHQSRDALNQGSPVDAIGNGGDDDLLAIAVFNNLRMSANAHRAVTCLQILTNARRPIDGATRWKIGALHVLHELLDRDVRVVDLSANAIDDLTEIVGRHVGRHPHRDPRSAVDEQVRKRRWKHRRLRQGLIVVRDEIDGLLFHVLHEEASKVRHARLGISHRRRRITFDGTKVPLRIHQWNPDGPGLAHIHQGRVNHRLAVRVVVPRGVTADLRALPVLLRRIERELVHRIQDAALRWLQTVSHVGQRPGDDDGHRVVEEGTLDFLIDVDGADTFGRFVRHSETAVKQD